MHYVRHDAVLDAIYNITNSEEEMYQIYQLQMSGSWTSKPLSKIVVDVTALQLKKKIGLKLHLDLWS